MLKATKPRAEGIEWQEGGDWWAIIKIGGRWCYKHSTTDFWSIGYLDISAKLHPVTNLMKRALLREHLKMERIRT